MLVLQARRILYLALFLSCVLSARSQQNYFQDDAIFFDCSIEDYYSTLSDDLTRVSDILRETHRQVLPYTSSSSDDVWDALIDLDSSQQNEGMIHLIYQDMDVTASEYGTPETWNREHLWPRSRGVGTSGPDNTDVHHLRPSDWNVNSARSNLFFGDCEDMCTSRPAHSEAAGDTGLDATMFLPPTDVRGDIARALFYMATRYNSLDETNTEVLQLTDCPDETLSNQMAYLSDLLRWHEEDPPDDSERLRNERVCSRWQGNRNIFVDFPELVTAMFGSPAEKPYDCDGTNNIPSAPTMSPSTMTSPFPDDVELGCGQLSPGDVQVVSLSSDNPDSVVMVTLADLPAGLELFMTDNAWTGTDFETNEGTLKLTLADSLSKGSIFGFGADEFIPLGDSWETVGSASFALATAGDSIIIYCLDENDYRHLGGIISGAWATTEVQELLDSNESQKPANLANVGAVEIGGGWDNLLYLGTKIGTKSEIISALADSGNWQGSNSERLVYSGVEFEIKETENVGEQLTPRSDTDDFDRSTGCSVLTASRCCADGILLAFCIVLIAAAL